MGKRDRFPDGAPSAEQFKAVYVADKVRHMNRHSVPAAVNPKTGAARPEWKRELDLAEEKKSSARDVRRIRGARDDIEWNAQRAARKRPRRAPTERDRWRRQVALARHRDALRRAEVRERIRPAE